ncbi:hypothetical protein NSERUTF1_7419 [Nocardia seriolae]|nr:hypothetical protein NSERUTF1_7419 [Nocardia seriolae]
MSVSYGFDAQHPGAAATRRQKAVAVGTLYWMAHDPQRCHTRSSRPGSVWTALRLPALGAEDGSEAEERRREDRACRAANPPGAKRRANRAE